MNPVFALLAFGLAVYLGYEWGKQTQKIRDAKALEQFRLQVEAVIEMVAKR